jgi:hypothetical protein
LLCSGPSCDTRNRFSSTFGLDFLAYAQAVPRFLPRLAGWEDEEQLTIGTRFVLTSFLEATLFLLAIPVSEVVEYLQGVGTVPVMLWVP